MVAMAAISDSASERFLYFLCTNRPDTSYQVSSQLAFGFGKSSSK